jgi:hypothetical protein
LRIARTARGNRKLSGTAPGNRRPPSAELSDCGLRQTNPSPGGVGHTSLTAPPEAAAQTKPIARSGAPRRCPPEHEEGQCLGGKGVMVNSTFDRPRQNKANSRQRRVGRGRRGVDTRQMCKTNPIRPVGGRPGPGGPTVRNKAKLGQSGVSRGRTVRPEGRLCETNPTRHRGPDGRSIVRNKPNYSVADCRLGIGDSPAPRRPPSSPPPRACAGRLYKQTQFLPRQG